MPLIAEALVIKRGGHADQLSRSMWGMDRYRVLALQKLLRSGVSMARARAAALDVLRRKVAILAQGARKRGKETEAARLRGDAHAEFDSGETECRRERFATTRRQEDFIDRRWSAGLAGSQADQRCAAEISPLVSKPVKIICAT